MSKYTKYKTFFIQFSKAMFLAGIVLLVLIGAVFYSLQNKKADKVYAGSGENVTGYAWSENVGWISFNNTSGGGSTNYGVNIMEDSVNGIGKLSGYAWSENVGWISFNRADTVAPPNNDVGAAYNVLAFIDSNNKLQGWARALSACDSVPCTTSGPGTNTGGWDGWVRFNNNSTYGVTLTPGSPNGLFSGYAWGSDVLGWISFSGPTYQVAASFELNLAPNAPSNLSVTPQYCDGRLVFSWTFSDPNFSSSLNQQSKYKIDISYPGFNYSTGEVFSSSASAIINLSNLGSWYGKTLNYTITVWDNASSPKSASASSSYGPLPSREYPLVNFSWNPTKIYAQQDVNFLDNSTCYSSGSAQTPCSGWLWTIPNAVYQQGTTSTDRNPIVQFPSTASGVNVSLQATDGGVPAYSCSVQKTINVNLPLPKIEEKK